MGDKLVIAEKGKLARDIARAICGKPNINDRSPLPISGNGYTVCAASGHLLELADPSEYDPSLAKWSIDALPIFFRDWKRVPKRARDSNGRMTAKPDEFAQAALERIESLIADADCVINAGDPDDEGQCLVDEIIDYLGYTGPQYRVYVNDSIEKNIRRAFDQAVDNGKARPDGEAAYARAMGDMVFGINESRLIGCRLHASNLSIGRVQTPTLGLIVNRDEAIESHEDIDFFEVACNMNCEGLSLAGKLLPTREFIAEHAADGVHITDREAVAQLASEVAKLGAVRLDSKNSVERKHAPMPYNITSLEADMNRRYHMTAADTLAVTQALRDKYSAITYNRTSSSYLKQEHYEQAPAVLAIACKNIGLDVPLDFGIKSKCFNDSKVTAHHGLIPQEIEVDISAMTAAEKKVYCAIVERYAMQFLPPAEYAVCKSEAETEYGTVRCEAKKLLKPGWTEYFGKPKPDAEDKSDQAADSSHNPFLADGKHNARIIDASIVAKKTRPPKPYTEATLLSDMSSIAKYVTDNELKSILKEKDADDPDENGGIGTSATRPSIIEKLKGRGFIEEKGGKLRSTERGRAVYHLIPNDMKTADVTARWWLICEDVRHGKADHNAVAESVVSEFMKHKDTAYVGVEIPACLRPKHSTERPVVGKCPRCGADVRLYSGSAQCSTNRFEKNQDGEICLADGCGWKLGLAVAHKKLSAKQVESLLSKGKVLAKGLRSSKGNLFDAYLVLKPDSGVKDAFAEVEFSFEGLPKRKGKAGKGSRSRKK